ncbi:MAG: hypothetical protein ABF932_04960, partial [Gluconobacter potus]|uniref:hypothetical protein n=2 Tax=Acetobacteraceae TaxID=433 RepID=UPI0039E7BB3E
FQPGRSLRRKCSRQTGCALIAAIQVAEEFSLKSTLNDTLKILIQQNNCNAYAGIVTRQEFQDDIVW